MKRIIIAIPSILAILWFSCRIQPADVSPILHQQPSTPALPATATQHTAANDSIIRILIGITGLLVASPADPLLLGKLDKISFDEENRAFLIVGRGLPSPAAPTYETRLASRERAARIMAEAAALCVKRRAHGANIPYTFGVKGKIAWMEKIHEEIRGDTLISVYRIPEGSIVP